jgi:hypothetical protein
VSVSRRFLVAGFAIVAVTTPAHADVHFDGRWRQSALREDFTVQSWIPSSCGQTPASNASGGGEVVSMRLEGDELTIVGGGRVYRSNTCYDPMPNLARESHSRDAGGKTWRTRCSTPANDPRKAILNTLVVATTDTHIDLIETGRYEIRLENGQCIADVKRTRSWDLVPDEAPKQPSATPATVAPPPPKPEPKPPQCESPGDPSRLEVRPSRKLMRNGETFAFRPIVLDDKGCATKTPTTWKLASGAEGKGVTVDGKGQVTVASDAPEGVVELVATAAGKDTRVAVEVTTAAHYDDLLAKSGLNSSGENDAAATVSIGTEAVGAGESRVEDRARTRRLIFIGIVGGALAILLALAFVFLRRTKRATALEKEAEERHDERVAEVMERRRRRAEEHAAQVRAHEASVEAAKRAQRAPPAPPAVENICPTCGREFPQKTQFCPNDGASLVPASKSTIDFPVPAAMARAAPAAAKRGKICPTCGERFDGGAEFCGKDGTQLVLLN